MFHIRRHNSKDSWIFLAANIIYFSASFLLYRFLCYRHSFSLSQVKLFISLFLLCTGTWSLISFRNFHNSFNLASNLILPWGIFSLLHYNTAWIIFAVSVLVNAGIISLLYCLLLHSPSLSLNLACRLHLGSKRLFSIYAVRNIFAAGMLLLMLPAVVYTFAGINFLTVPGNPDISSFTVENQMDIITCLQEEKWKNLTIQQKESVLQTIANIEVNFLRMDNLPTVQITDLASEGALGCFSYDKTLIQLDDNHVADDSSLSVLYTLCHEVFHQFQWHLVELYNTESDASYSSLSDSEVIEKYRLELYDGSPTDYTQYYNQLTETDARNYAYLRVLFYMGEITANS